MTTCHLVIWVVISVTNHGYWEPVQGQSFYNRDQCEEAAKLPDNRPHGEAKCIVFRATVPGGPRGDHHAPGWCR
jgi:hypothetical protein